MGILDKITAAKKEEQPQPQAVVDPNRLSPPELQLLLQMLAETTIKGSQVELFYNLILKLQNQYLEQTK